MIYKYQACIETYVNGKLLKDCDLQGDVYGNSWYEHQKGDVFTYGVSKKIDGKSVGVTHPFKTKLKAWQHLEQFEEGKI